MATVLIHSGPRALYRVPLVEDEELFCGPEVPNPAPPGQWRAPVGTFDIAAFIKTLPRPFNNPNMLVVFYDSERRINPMNLAAVKCPRILSIGDTHHLTTPLQTPIDLAKREPYDLVLLEYNRQHLHFFLEAGIKQARWLPSFAISPIEHKPHPPGMPRERRVSFLGSQDRHPYRSYILQELPKRGVEVDVGRGSHAGIATEYTKTRVNLNISLNGDLNQRIFEIPAAGGFMITDRLSPESGLELLLKNGRQITTFDTVEHLIDLIRHYLAHPLEADAIATAGNQAYMHRHRPQDKIRDLHAMLRGDMPTEYDAALERRTLLANDPWEKLRHRIALYEILRNLHRDNGKMDILFWKGMERAASDAVDLPRATVSIVRDPATHAPNVLAEAGLADRVNWIDPRALVGGEKWGDGHWNVVVCEFMELQDWQFVEFHRRKGANLAVILHSNPDDLLPQLAIPQAHTSAHLLDAITKS
ncbi:MAG TPA: glycosyltransferase [Phycisphaerae bacterium]|jgi:hypothetical protein